MRASAARQDFRVPLIDFLEACYEFERNEPSWLSRLLCTHRKLWRSDLPGFAYAYDASDVTRLRLGSFTSADLPPSLVAFMRTAMQAVTPRIVRDNYRGMSVAWGRATSPEVEPLFQ
jgi:hypothetical protein